MAWFELADRLRTPVQLLQSLTTSTEFLEWQAYLERDRGLHKREDWYAAQTAAEIRRTVMGKKAGRVKIEQFLLRFKAGNKPAVAPTEQEIATRTAMSKARWFAVSGLAGQGKTRTRRPPPAYMHGKPREE